MTLASWWQSIHSSARRSVSATKRGTVNKQLKPRRVRFETLEDRNLMAVVLDPRFGTRGVTTTDFPQATEAANMTRAPDGKLVLVGTMGDGSRGGDGTQLTVARYNPDGSPDTTFSGDGKAIFKNLDVVPYFHAVAVQQDGKVIVGGESLFGGGFVVVRLRANGRLDKSFGNNGTASAFGFGGAVEDIDVLPNGKILAIGTAPVSNLNSQNGFAMARFTRGGNLDNTFGTRGLVRTSFGGVRAGANGMRIFPDGKILLAGSATFNGGKTPGTNFALAKYNANGRIDTTFGKQGIVVTRLSANTDIARDPMLLRNGKIVVAGTTSNKSGRVHNFAVAQYLANGRLDTSFSQDGKLFTNFGPGSDDVAINIRPQSNNRLLVTGSARVGKTSDLAMSRYLANGRLDPSFGTGGKLVTDLGGFETGPAVNIPGRNLILVGGQKNGDFLLARFVERPNQTQLASGSGTSTKTTSSAGATATSSKDEMEAWTLTDDSSYANSLDAWFAQEEAGSEGLVD